MKSPKEMFFWKGTKNTVINCNVIVQITVFYYIVVIIFSND